MNFAFELVILAHIQLYTSGGLTSLLNTVYDAILEITERRTSSYDLIFGKTKPYLYFEKRLKHVSLLITGQFDNTESNKDDSL